MQAASTFLTATVVSDRLGYDADGGGQIHVKVELENTGDAPVELVEPVVVLRHLGTDFETRQALTEPRAIGPGQKHNVPYFSVCDLGPRIPLGGYVLALECRVLESSAQVVMPGRPLLVFRRKIEIDWIRTDRPVYAPGDTIRLNVRMTNHGNEPASGLGVVVGKMYPHILPYAQDVEPPFKSRDTYEFRVEHPGPFHIPPGESVETGFFEVETAPDSSLMGSYFAWIPASGDTFVHDIQTCTPFVVEAANLNGLFPYSFEYNAPTLDQIHFQEICFSPIDSYDDTPATPEPTLPERWISFFPHVDDHLTCTTLIQRSVKRNIPFKVVYLVGAPSTTCHEYFGDTEITPEHRAYVCHATYKEGRRHLEFLGAKPDDLVFFGLPDGAMLHLYHNSPNDGCPMWMPNCGTDRVWFPYAYQPGLVFHKTAIVRALKRMIEAEVPTDIFLPRPDERHLEHAYTYYYVMDAIKALEAETGKRINIHVNKWYGEMPDPPELPPLKPDPFLEPTHRELVRFFLGVLIFQLEFKVVHLGLKGTDMQSLKEHVAYRIPNWYSVKRT